MSTVNIAIFASGSGTNAEQITNYFHNNTESDIKVKLILSNRPDAFVLERAKKLGVETITFNKNQFFNSLDIVDILKANGIEFIILAGFLLLVPSSLIDVFQDRIINIHPALLPKYGGKGMYGERVHQAVVENKETESGITIHLVDEIYDNGKILRQEKCIILPNDSADDVAKKIHNLEYQYFPKTIEEFIANN